MVSLRMLLLSPCCPMIPFRFVGLYFSTRRTEGSAGSKTGSALTSFAGDTRTALAGEVLLSFLTDSSLLCRLVSLMGVVVRAPLLGDILAAFLGGDSLVLVLTVGSFATGE